ncbi:MAG: hypothetical protein JW812_02650 [Alphaproteobacteria bacterium]|nr:hypothetical protein [Alphaproteobacteria bacterium]MBN2779443.1 hypothetical protein [Alphaproteobacteria bacterium]
MSKFSLHHFLILLSPLIGFVALFSEAAFQSDQIPHWLPTLITFSSFALPSLILFIVLYFACPQLTSAFALSGTMPTFVASCWVVWMLLFGPPDPLSAFAVFVVPVVGLVAMPFSLLLSYFIYKQMEKYDRKK